jgi:hypothetical protein
MRAGIAQSKQILLAERSKARACGRSLAKIAGSNPTRGIDVCVVCCTVKDKRQSQDSHDKEAQIKYREQKKEVGIGTYWGLDRHGFESRRWRDFMHPFRPALGLQPTSNTMGTGIISRR